MRRCCINGCRSNYGLPYVPIFLFPKDDERRKLWEESIAQPGLKISNQIGVCIKHFEKKNFTRCDVLEIVNNSNSEKRKIKLKSDSVPTVFPGSNGDDPVKILASTANTRATGMDVQPIEANVKEEIEVIDISDEEERENLPEPSTLPNSPAPSGRIKDEERPTIKDTFLRKRRSSSVGSNSSNGSNDVMKSPAPSLKRRKPEKAPPTVTGRDNDCYCWVCHKEGITLTCISCPRAYHQRCASELDYSSEWVCVECNKMTEAESEDFQSKTMTEISSDRLCMLLKCCISKLKSRAPTAFHQPVPVAYYSSYLDYVIHPMDLSLIEKNVKQKVYGCTESFLADVKWLAHNSFVFNGAQHPLTLNARSLVKLCESDMTEIEVCPDCFLHAYNRNKHWFSEICRKPHPLVWAKLKGFPYWPAKVARIVNNEIDARFFGAHDRAWVPVSQCYHLSKEMPTSSKPKKKGNYEIALEELNVHVQILKEKYSTFVYAPYRTPFDQSNTVYAYHGIDIANTSTVDEAKDAKDNLAFVPQLISSPFTPTSSLSKQPQMQSVSDAESKDTPATKAFSTHCSLGKHESMELDGAVTPNNECESECFILPDRGDVTGICEVTRKLDFDMPKICDVRGSAYDVKSFDEPKSSTLPLGLVSVSNFVVDSNKTSSETGAKDSQQDVPSTNVMPIGALSTFIKPTNMPPGNKSICSEQISNISYEPICTENVGSSVKKSIAATKADESENSKSSYSANFNADSLNSISNSSLNSVISSDPDLECFKKLEDTLERINKIYSIESDEKDQHLASPPVEGKEVKEENGSTQDTISSSSTQDVQSNAVSQSKQPAPKVLAASKKNDLFSQKLDETIKSCIAKLGINEVDMNESSSSESSEDDDDGDENASSADDDGNSDEESSSSSEAEGSSDSSSAEESDDETNKIEGDAERSAISVADSANKILVGELPSISCENEQNTSGTTKPTISIDQSLVEDGAMTSVVKLPHVSCVNESVIENVIANPSAVTEKNCGVPTAPAVESDKDHSLDIAAGESDMPMDNLLDKLLTSGLISRINKVIGKSTESIAEVSEIPVMKSEFQLKNDTEQKLSPVSPRRDCINKQEIELLKKSSNQKAGSNEHIDMVEEVFEKKGKQAVAESPKNEEKSLLCNSSSSEDIDIYENMGNLSPSDNKLQNSDSGDNSCFMEQRKEVTLDEVLGLSNLNFQEKFKTETSQIDKRKGTIEAVSTSGESGKATKSEIHVNTKDLSSGPSDDKLDSVGSSSESLSGRKADCDNVHLLQFDQEKSLDSIECEMDIDKGELRIDVDPILKVSDPSTAVPSKLISSKIKSEVFPLKVIDIIDLSSSDSESELSINESISKAEVVQKEVPSKESDQSIFIELSSDSSANVHSNEKNKTNMEKASVRGKDKVMSFTDCFLQKTVKDPEPATIAAKVNKGKITNSELSLRGITTLKSTCSVGSKASNSSSFKASEKLSTFRVGMKRPSIDNSNESISKREKKEEASHTLSSNDDSKDKDAIVVETANKRKTEILDVKETEISGNKTEDIESCDMFSPATSISDTCLKSPNETSSLHLEPMACDDQEPFAESSLNDSSIENSPASPVQHEVKENVVSPKENKDLCCSTADSVTSKENIPAKDKKGDASHKPSKAEKEVKELKELLRTLRFKYEKQELYHQQELEEWKHNMHICSIEMRLNMEISRKLSIKAALKQWELQKAKAVDEAKLRQWCASCKLPSVFYCCWNTSYCSYSCQKHHWPEHRFLCSQKQMAKPTPSARPAMTEFVKIAKKPAPDAMDTNNGERKIVYLMKPPDELKAATISSTVDNSNQVSATNQSKMQFVTSTNHLQIVPSSSGKASANNNISLPHGTNPNVQIVLAPVIPVNDKCAVQTVTVAKPKSFQDSADIITKVRSRKTDLTTAIHLLNKMNKETEETLKKKQSDDNAQEEVVFSLPTSSMELNVSEMSLVDNGWKIPDGLEDDEEESVVLEDEEDHMDTMVPLGVTGIELSARKLKQCEKIGVSATKLTRCLLSAFFSREELAKSSAFGRKSNITKQTRPALSMEIVNAILGYVMDKFQFAQRTDLVLAMNFKCKEARRKMSESAATEDIEINGLGLDFNEDISETVNSDVKLSSENNSLHAMIAGNQQSESAMTNKGKGTNKSADNAQVKTVLVDMNDSGDKNTQQQSSPTQRFVASIASLPNNSTVTCKLPQLATNVTTFANIIPSKNVHLVSNPNLVKLGGAGGTIVTIPRALQPCLVNSQSKASVRPKSTILTVDKQPANVVPLSPRIIPFGQSAISGKAPRNNSPVIYAVKNVRTSNSSNVIDTSSTSNVVPMQDCSPTERRPILFLEVPTSSQQAGINANKQDSSITKNQED